LTLTKAASFDTIRINCGGGDSLDSAGNLWAADQYFENNGGTHFSWSCANTPDIEPYYCSERNWNKWHGHAQPYAYEIPVPNGPVQVDLHFAEIVSTVAVLLVCSNRSTPLTTILSSNDLLSAS